MKKINKNKMTGNQAENFKEAINLEAYVIRYSNLTEVPIQNKRCAEALAEGYKIAMICSRTYSPALFLEKEDLTMHVRGRIIEAPRNIAINATDPHLYTKCLAFAKMAHDNNVDLVESKQREAFICGFKYAFHNVGKYDDCLVLEGHLLESYVFANILSHQKKFEDALWAQDRIIAAKFGISKEQFRDMTTDHAHVDNNGDEVNSSRNYPH